MDFFSDVWFDLLLFAKSLPVFLIKLLALYVVVKFAVKKALEEHRKEREEKREEK